MVDQTVRKTLSPTLSVGSMEAEGMAKGLRRNAWTSKAIAKAVATMITISAAVPSRLRRFLFAQPSASPAGARPDRTGIRS